ncbi:cytochrome P450 [Aquimarina sp. 2201CG5-10]|uniref:cytochrome P450 n=1 Tax=Aquimarina callyspongiae TaxID=3098150 RepID=UPI002AB5D07A|nr:cytochrome P450 [Aquimarina sp. 2201CG5-10]MDY8136236.1 cytochrome P450 [Aquimarina sp. 2201CG5-10]
MKDSVQSEIPGKTTSILPWGDLMSFFKDYHKFKQKKIEKYGEIYKIKILNKEISTLHDKESVNFTLVQHAKDFNSKEAWELILKDLFPNGLMLMDGDTHKDHRSIIAEAFKKEPMEGYLEMMKDIVPSHINSWNNPNPKIFPLLKEFTLKIALQVFFGIDKNQQFPKINEAISNIVDASSALPIKLPFTAYNKGIKARKYLVKFFKELLPERKNHPKKDLFSILATAKNEDGQSLNDEQIIDHLIFILMAAHDTTASTQTSFCYFLAKYPEWQNKLRTEARLFYKEHKDDFKVKDLRKLEHLNLALKETLRMFPPLVSIGRVATKELEYKGYQLQKGTQVSIDIDQNHHNPEVWSCPGSFDPDRFSKERSEHTKCPYTYTPFGAGSHYCIGFAFAEMQIKYVISQLLLTHEWSVPENYEMPVKPVPLQVPEDGLPVSMKKIN